MAKCKTCGAPVNLAPDGDPRYEKPRVRKPDPVQAMTLIERIYYMEGKDANWRAAHMNGVARDFQNGASLAWASRLFPRNNQEGDKT
tara:strand:- start:444 stop:704 length:261 start_codon:yes stop_codon:yes gene_type:complete